MNGLPVGGPSSFRQSMEQPHPSTEPYGEKRGGVFVSPKTPTTNDEELELPSPNSGFGEESSIPRLGLGALLKREGMRGKRKPIDKDELSEDLCFVCKDGGDIRVCDFKACLKSYHPHCVKKDDSFLESDERWTCGWHSCYNCYKASTLKCFCCPYSSCRACTGKANFVQVKGTKGFCNDCLRLAKLIEENVNVDSDGGTVDFEDTETYEFLFKDYWEIVKEKERLTLANLQSVDALFKRGEKFTRLSDSDDHSEEQEEAELSDDNCDDEIFPSKDFKRKHNRMKMLKEKPKTKKKTYVGWASLELIEFLASLGKDTQNPLGQHDVYDIIKEYIQLNNLLGHNKKKKKHVFCDARLLSLFRRKKVNFFKVYSLLEKHFTENDDSYEDSFSLEEDDYAKSTKKQRMEKPPARQKAEREYFTEPTSKNCFAAITENNINSVYLRRSLIVELMGDLKTFETKVVGCFVRRKSDPKDFYGSPPKMHELGQITGVKKALDAYKLGDMSTDTVLRVSNYWNDVQISMLSDDNFEEEECEDLKHFVKKGLVKRPIIAELEEKIRIIHEDMVKHSVKKELLRLEKLIERANEKGWRRELFDYIERKKMLNKPEEVLRLMKELPEITADIEDGNSHVPAKNATEPNEGEFQGGIQNATSRAVTATDKIIVYHKTDGGIQNATSRAVTATDKIIVYDKTDDGAIRTSYSNASNPDEISAEERNTVRSTMGSDADPGSSLMDVAIADKRISDEKIEGHGSIISKENVDVAVIEIDDEEEASEKGLSDVQIVNPDAAADANPIVENGDNPEKIWNYMDPSGNVQGPFSITTLKHWKDEGFFDEDFRIWKAWQSQQDAIPLFNALGLLGVP